MLNDQRGNSVSLSDFLGKKVEQYVAAIGISKDSVASHLRFAEKYNLPFVLMLTGFWPI